VEASATKIGALGLAGDISDASRMEQIMVEAGEAHGPVRTLVNCAGIGPFAPVIPSDGQPMPLSEFERIIKINLVGIFNAIRLAAAQMITLDPLPDGSRGIIVNTSSIAGLDGGSESIPYTATKGAINAITLGLAREFGNAGIRVVTICPGPIETPMLDSAPNAFRDKLQEFIVFPKRTGRPDEFANLALHLCENDFINGTIVRLDGGLRAPYVSAG